MSNSLASAGLDHVIDAVDTTSALAVESVKATVGVAEASLNGAVSLGEKTADQVLAEVETLRKNFVDALRHVAGMVADAVPVGAPGPVNPAPPADPPAA